jgi:hypothetical protein
MRRRRSEEGAGAGREGGATGARTGSPRSSVNSKSLLGGGLEGGREGREGRSSGRRAKIEAPASGRAIVNPQWGSKLVAQGAWCDGSWSRFPRASSFSGVSFFSLDMVAAAAAGAWCGLFGYA